MTKKKRDEPTIADVVSRIAELGDGSGGLDLSLGQGEAWATVKINGPQLPGGYIYRTAKGETGVEAIMNALGLAVIGVHQYKTPAAKETQP